MGLGPYERLNLLDFVGKDELFLELLDWPQTFPKVWGLLGWNIQLYHSHMTVTPVVPPEERPAKQRLGWHQDSGRLNQEMESEPRPRVSLKVAFLLTDTREAGRGNFSVIPGSHRQNKVEYPADGISDPAGATPVCVGPGAAVFFDRPGAPWADGIPRAPTSLKFRARCCSTATATAGFAPATT
jgi:hypothetical protein